MLEIGIGLCSRAHAIIQSISFRGDGGASATSEVWDKPAVPQTGLVVLRLRSGGALVAFLNASGLGVDGGILPGDAVDAEEVLDLLTGGVVDLGVGAKGLAGEAALLVGVRHVGVLSGREASHGRCLVGRGVVWLTACIWQRRDRRE